MLFDTADIRPILAGLVRSPVKGLNPLDKRASCWDKRFGLQPPAEYQRMWVQNNACGLQARERL